MGWKRSSWIPILFLMSLLTVQVTTGLTRQANALPLADDGAYNVGIEADTVVDPNRPDWQLGLTIWYPATESRSVEATTHIEAGLAMVSSETLLKAAAKNRSATLESLDAGQQVDVLDVKGNWARIKKDNQEGWVSTEHLITSPAMPYLNHAPYPLIIFAPYPRRPWDDDGLLRNLASHGFVVVSIQHNCIKELTCLIDRPLDIIAVIDQLAKKVSGNLAGVIDTNHVGVMGFSYGGYAALATTGAQIESANLLKQRDPIVQNSFGIFCWTDAKLLRGAINRAVSAYPNELNPDHGQMWLPITDERIKAVVAIAPAFDQMFGEQGIASATVPTLMIAAKNDSVVSYEREIVPAFTHFGAPNSYLITIDGYDNNMMYFPQSAAYVKQFSTAFFEDHLQGHEDAADYFDPSYVGQFSDLGLDASQSQ